MKYRKCVLITVFVCVCSLSYGQEENRDNKQLQHPELSNLVRNWASKISGELWHFGKMVTRETKVQESFKDTTVILEDGEALLTDIHEKLSSMMHQKVEAVRRIMETAEQAAQGYQPKDVDGNFTFYNAKNLTNSAPNDTEDNVQNDYPNLQELRYDDSFISDVRIGERYQAMVQPEETDGYQQDQDQNMSEDVSSKDEETLDTEEDVRKQCEKSASNISAGTNRRTFFRKIRTVTDKDEKDPQASQTQPEDKTKLPLYKNRHFYNMPVNTNYSAVHVPSNVYERSSDVLSGIIWSEELDKIFTSNYKIDPTLSWQYFGSSTGFMRQFPAMIWYQEPIDLFDCRTRSWYIEAASSPKDIVILVDRSGSMTGMRREVARHVVHNILDTLGNNDYVNIFTFSNTTDPLVECLDGKLVQANMANIKVFKESMTEFKTEQIANFSLALTIAFELLEEYRELKLGANCNQAIMLITDGSQYNYKEVFEKYNWGNLPFMNVRVFTYLIGREVSDPREVKWMACANQGYYVHLSTYAEVREEVLHYIPVMARPMVLSPERKPNPTWSPVYADVTDPKLTNWLWVNRQRSTQKDKFMIYGEYKDILTPDEIDKKFVHQQKLKQDHYGETQTYHMMTSVSLPVYDKKPRQERVANLLGVAGTDIPVEYIQRLMLPYRLGVNGYAFIVTNNGYILIHPDLRPVYQGILKPAYNMVDMMEVEIMDDDAEARAFSDEIKEFRRRVVMQMRGNINLTVKAHINDMKRVITLKRHYYYMGINGTPFSLVIVLPNRYGFSRVQHPVENDIHRIRSSDKIKGSLTQFFTGNWTIHPDWHYCRYRDDKHYFKTPEEEFLHFLRKMEGPGWKWSGECDRKLICKVVADAKITSWFSQNITTSTKEENGAQLIQNYAVVVAFLATHSGLTRWQNFPQNINKSIHETHFSKHHNKAIDEVWYKRAVDHYFTDPSNFVYSVAPEIGEDSNHTLVTVSHAIFREDGNKRAPAAVIGYQFYHKALFTLFRNITTKCGDTTKACKRTCESQELHCLMLDDGGYVVVSDVMDETGYFFGTFRPDIMGQLVEEGIYKITRMYDYQGLCSEGGNVSSPATRMRFSLSISEIATWAISTLSSLLHLVLGDEYEPYMYTDHHNINEHRANNDHVIYDESSQQPFDSEFVPREERNPQKPYLSDKEYIERATIPKTKPQPCDTEMYLYSLVHYTERNVSNSGYNKTMIDCSRPYIIQPVIGSNMLLLVINNLCKEQSVSIPSPEPVKVDHNMSFPCFRNRQEYPRRLYMSCINRNINESEIKLCGGGTYISSQYTIPLLIIARIIFKYFV